MTVMGGGVPKAPILEECLAGVVVNEGPHFHIEIRKVSVREPGALLS